MNWFTKLIGSGVTEVVDSVGNAIDKLVTSDEEKLTLKNEASKIIAGFKGKVLEGSLKLEAEYSKRHSVDMQSDSWLSKNVRPLIVVFLTFATIILAYSTIFVLTPNKVELVKPWIGVLTPLTTTAYGFYFGSRGMEKITKIKNLTK